jgi:hypothetical protein
MEEIEKLLDGDDEVTPVHGRHLFVCSNSTLFLVS